MRISDQLRASLEKARSLCVLTGAGVSAESGVPTFRGNEGLWSKFRPEELANFNSFIKNPDLVWEWYSYRKKVVWEVKPNPAHDALAEMEESVQDFTLVTQNVDNLHARAGSKRILELHGNIMRSYCIKCRKQASESELEELRKTPVCEFCGGLVRPDVVWFGEVLPGEVFNEAAEAAGRCDLFLCVGTSGVVYPAASLPLIAREAGAYVVEVNQGRTELSPRLDETLVGKAGEILPELARILHERRVPSS